MRPNEDELADALASLARIIDRYGDVYWPLFERLERELECERSRKARLAAYWDRSQGSKLLIARRKVPMEKGERSSGVDRV
jgi:hypothetical protein